MGNYSTKGWRIMKVIVVSSYDELSISAAEVIEHQVRVNPFSVLGLATGSTPIGTYRTLVKKHLEEKLDFSRVTTFNLDEYCNIEPSNPQSYAYFMKENFFSKVNIADHMTNLPESHAEDIEAVCMAYENKISSRGGIDLQLLGIGRNGHIGFNEPGDSFKSDTHRIKLDERTIKDNARFFKSIDDVPRYAISMGIKTIFSAKKILLIASGVDKAEIIYEMIHGQVRPAVPATILQMHPDVTVILDKDAAALLERRRTFN